MNPIGHINQQFSDDYHRFILQDDMLRQHPPQGVEPEKKFDLKNADKAEKSKKDNDKQKEKKKRPFNFDEQ